jgi:hypothetical protein
MPARPCASNRRKTTKPEKMPDLPAMQEDTTANLPSLAARHGFEPLLRDWQSARVQVTRSLRKALSLALLTPDARASLQKTGDVLTVGGRSPTQKGRAPRRSSKPDGMTRSDGKKGGHK